mmetsp:Transcript_126663/g.270232  ORF Transcript_126663/g.270232 Transcript_126663/m.270232 type:complete len:426 (-) Transcript_126663:1057-2334(-)
MAGPDALLQRFYWAGRTAAPWVPIQSAPISSNHDIMPQRRARAGPTGRRDGRSGDLRSARQALKTHLGGSSKSRSSTNPSFAIASCREGLFGPAFGVPVQRTSSSPEPAASASMCESFLRAGAAPDSAGSPAGSFASASSASSRSQSPSSPSPAAGVGWANFGAFGSFLKAVRKSSSSSSSTRCVRRPKPRAARSSSARVISSGAASPSFGARGPVLGAEAVAPSPPFSKSSATSSSKPPAIFSGLAISAVGLTKGLPRSSQLSKTASASLESSFLLIELIAGPPATGAPPFASSMSEAFTVHTPSRSSTRYFGTHVPLALSPQMAPRAVAHKSHCCQSGSDTKVLRLPITMQPRLARVSITFSRRQSDKKPTLPSLLFRTAQKMMTSFSCPWKPSTDSTSRPVRNFWSPGRSRMSFLMKLTWPL